MIFFFRQCWSHKQRMFVGRNAPVAEIFTLLRNKMKAVLHDKFRKGKRDRENL